MCDVDCKVKSSRVYSFKVDGYSISISIGSYEKVSIGMFSMYGSSSISFDNMKELKKFCEKTLVCLEQIENES